VDNGMLIKARLNLKIDKELKRWVMEYAKKRGTDVTKLITEYFIFLREREQRQDVEYIEQI
jgi:hypothetical protein